MKNILIAALVVFSSSSFGQIDSRESTTTIPVGNHRLHNGSVSISTVILGTRTEAVYMFVSDKHVISTNLLTLSLDDAIRLRDSFIQAVKLAEENKCKRMGNC